MRTVAKTIRNITEIRRAPSLIGSQACRRQQSSSAVKFVNAVLGQCGVVRGGAGGADLEGSSGGGIPNVAQDRPICCFRFL